MAKFSVSYDLAATTPSPHKPFLDAAAGEGLLYVLKANDLYRLPNTTVWGNFFDRDACRTAFDRALTIAEAKIGRKIVLEKRLIAEFTNFYVRSDKRKAAEQRWTGATDFETCLLHQMNDPFFR